MRVLKNPKVNLENKKKIFFQIGAIIALLLVIVAFEYRTYEPDEKHDDVFRKVEVDEEWAEVSIQKPKPPPELPKQRPQTIEIVPDDKIESSTDIIIDVSGEGPIEEYVLPSIPDEPEIPGDSIFVSVQQKPEFPGGLSQLYKYFGSNINYPMQAKESGISGRVFLNFVVEPDGSISNVIVLRGIGGGCDEEAVRVVQSMPLWEPGKQRGRAVRVSFTVPIKFTLQ